MKGDCGFQASKSTRTHHKNSPCATDLDVHLMREVEEVWFVDFRFKFGFVQWISWSGRGLYCNKS